MLLLFFLKLAISQSFNICVCHLNKCIKACQKSSIGEVFEIAQPSNFEQLIINKLYSSRSLFMNFNVYVTFNDHPIRFNLSSFNNLRISFKKYFDFADVDNKQSNILIKFENDDYKSCAQLQFSESDVIITDSNTKESDKSTVVLDFIELEKGSTLKFDKKTELTVLRSKCCSLKDFSFMIFDEIHVENGFCREDFILSANSIHKLRFNQYNSRDKKNYFIYINDNVKVFGALRAKFVSKDNSDLMISSLSNARINSVLSLDSLPHISLYSFGQIVIEQNSVLTSQFFLIDRAKSIICKSSFLLANFHDTDLYIERDVIINGTVFNLSIFSIEPPTPNHISLTLSSVHSSINIKSSNVDVNINNYNVNYENPITFCVGKGGISKVSIKSLIIKPGLTVKTAFLKLIVNRDFQNYLSDSDLSTFLNRYNTYLELPTSKTYLLNQDHEPDLTLQFTDSTKMIHGFNEFDSILTPIEISENPQVFAVYFNSPNKKLLKLCLSSNQPTNNNNNNCYYINNRNMNQFTNNLLAINSGIENVLIEIQHSFKNEKFNFQSFNVKNLTITSNWESKVEFGSFNFIGDVASNITITNIHNFSLNINPKQKDANIKNIAIFNCKMNSITTESNEIVKINNFSICQIFDFPSIFEINNLNFYSDFSDKIYILASYDNESIFTSTFVQFNLSNFGHFNFYFPYIFNHDQDEYQYQKSVYVFVNTQDIPNYSIYITSENISLYFFKWDDFPDIVDKLDYEFNIRAPYLTIKSDSISESFLSVHNFDFNIKTYFSIQPTNIRFFGNGFITSSQCFKKERTLNVDTLQNERLDTDLNKIANEKVYVNFNHPSFISVKPRVMLSSLHDKIVYIMNYHIKAQKVYLYDTLNQNQLFPIIDDENNEKSFMHTIYLYGIELYLRSIPPDQSLNDHHFVSGEVEENDDDVHRFSKVYFDDIILLEGSKFKGFQSDEITFRKLDCKLKDIYPIGNNVIVKEQLVLSGKIEDKNFVSKKTIYLQSDSFLNLTLKDKELKISIGEYLIVIGNFVFDGLSHAEINIDSDAGFKYTILPIRNENGVFNFDLFPKISFIQKPQNESSSVHSDRDEEEEVETYKILNMKTKDNRNIIKKIKETKASKFVNFPNNNNVRRIQKVRDSEQSFPLPLKNSIYLEGDWAGCESKFSFYNLKNVDFTTDSEVVPFHFISTIGQITLIVKQPRTDFIGNFHFTNAQQATSVNLISQNNNIISNSKYFTNITFCESFGGLMNVSFYFYQPNILASFRKVAFTRPNLLTFHLYMSIDGYSSFSCYEGSSQVNSITYLNFNCSLELTDEKVINFLNEKENVLALFIDLSYSDRIILGWDVFPSTHGLYESYQIYFSRSTRKLLYIQRSSPYEVPWAVCVTGFDICDVNIESEELLDDIRPFVPRGKSSILLFLSNDGFDSPINFDYPFFDNFTVYCIGMGLIDIKLKLGHNHVSSLDITEASVTIVDDNYSIDYVRIEGYSKIKNTDGIKKLYCAEYQPFKLSNISFFPGRISIPSVYDQIVFQKEGIKFQSPDNPQTSLHFNISQYPDFEIRFDLDKTHKQNEFLIEDDVNDSNIPNISLNFSDKTSILIGKGWEKIHKTSVLNDVYGLSNIDQIITESFPFQPLLKLLNQEGNDDAISVYPSEKLFPISVPSEATLSANESMIINLSELLNDKNSNLTFKPNIVFKNTVVMNDNSQIQVLDESNKKATSQGLDDCYIEIEKLIISKNSSASLSSAKIVKELDVKESSKLYGNLNFMPNSTLIINGKVNIHAFELFDFPSIIFDSYPSTMPSKIIVKLTINLDNITNDDNADAGNNNSSRSIKRDDVPKWSSIEDNPGVVVSNLGFMCSRWEEIIQITGSQHFFFVPVCVNGYLKVVRIMNNDDDKESLTVQPVLPTMTPYKINISEYVRPTMTHIFRQNEVHRGLSNSFIGVIVVAVFFILFFIILFLVVYNLKKKYNKLLEAQDEEENNNANNNDYDVQSDDVLKL